MTRVVRILIYTVWREGQRQNKPLAHRMQCIKIIGSTQLSCDPRIGALTSCLKQICNQTASCRIYRRFTGRSKLLV